MTKEEVEDLERRIPEEESLDKLYEWKDEAYSDRVNIAYQMEEWKRKNSERIKKELADYNTYTIDEQGKEKYNRQWLAYKKRGVLMTKIDTRIGQIKRKIEHDFYHFFFAFAKQELAQDTFTKLQQQAFQESNKFM